MKENIHIDSTEIFEWYDGIVLGLARMQDVYFLACLLAFDPGTKRKRYLLISLSQEQSQRLRTLFNENGLQAFNKLVISEIVAHSANLYLTSTEPEEGKTVTLTLIDADQRIQLQNLSFPLIDDAVDPSVILQWLDK
jgi:hypothetical protein